MTSVPARARAQRGEDQRPDERGRGGVGDGLARARRCVVESLRLQREASSAGSRPAARSRASRRRAGRSRARSRRARRARRQHGVGRGHRRHQRRAHPDPRRNSPPISSHRRVGHERERNRPEDTRITPGRTTGPAPSRSVSFPRPASSPSRRCPGRQDQARAERAVVARELEVEGEDEQAAEERGAEQERRGGEAATTRSLKILTSISGCSARRA